ncbi:MULTISPECIES: hypothetical protein [Rhizobium]|uniref:hypothetical protein n=1 Tax=Rhizobium sp. WYCCWR 11152 TaxID=2692316 RepID=UPI001FE78741|nr:MULTISPECIES: hypothetical protein [Rhizobium]
MTREAGAQVAISFVDALQLTFGLIARHPASGSLRYAYELGLPDLRSMTVKAFPYVNMLSEPLLQGRSPR